MKKHITCLVCLIFLISVKSYADENKSIHMACSTFPPFKINDTKNPGIDVEVMQSAWSINNWKVDFRFYPWNRALAMTTEGAADGLCGCSFRPDREENFLFSDIMGHHSQGIFTKQDGSVGEVKSLSDLKGRSIATVRGYAIQKELDALGIESISVVTDAQAIAMLNKGHVDAVYAYRDIVLYDIGRGNAKQPLSYFELSSQPYYVCISRKIKNSAKILEDLNKGLRRVRHSGQYRRIHESYLLTN